MPRLPRALASALLLTIASVAPTAAHAAPAAPDTHAPTPAGPHRLTPTGGPRHPTPAHHAAPSSRPKPTTQTPRAVATPRAGAADATTSAGVPADFNGDGKPDLVYVNATTGEMKVVYMDGATQLGEDALGQVGQDWWLAAVASYNGDGQPDLYFRNYATGENQVWLMHGINQVSTVSLPPLADTNWVLSAAADFDGDGQTDLVWRNYQTHEVQLWLMNGASLANTVALPLAAPDFELKAASDVNGDGQVDIIWDNPYRGQNDVLLMNGTSVATNSDLTKGVDTNWRISGNPYVSPDGHAGIILRNYLTGHNEVMVFDWNQSDPTRPKVDSARSFDLPAEPDTTWLLVDPVGVDPRSIMSAQEVLYLQAEDTELYHGGYNNWDGDASRLCTKWGQLALPGPSYAYPPRAATSPMYQYRKQQLEQTVHGMRITLDAQILPPLGSGSKRYDSQTGHTALFAATGEKLYVESNDAWN